MPGGIRRCEHEHAFVGVLHAIEFRQELVDQMPACAVPHVAAGRAQRVYFVEKQDAGFVIPSLLKQLVQVFLTLSDPHVEDVADANGEEVCLDLAGCRARQMGFSASWRAIHQNASANRLAVRFVKFSVCQWMNNLDPAFRRPGRFDRILFVPPPDAKARSEILRVLLRGKPVADIDCDHVAKKCDAFSGADLKALIDVAIEAKLREAMKDGIPKPLTTKDLTAAAGTIKPTTKEWFSTARNYALYANQGGAYDDVLKYMKL
jgi:hypothetical protein